MAADCWDDIRGVCVIVKLAHHRTFPKDDCKQAITLAGELRSDTLVKVI